MYTAVGMYNSKLLLLIVLVISGADVSAGQNPITPHDGMVISKNTIFKRGTYLFPHGVTIGASNIHLDLGGAILTGMNGKNFGVTIMKFDNVTLSNGSISNYYYAVNAIHASNLIAHGLDLSHNWVDPKSNSTWLNINTPADLSDRANHGGGMYLLDCVNGVISHNTASFQQSGFDLFTCHNMVLTDNTAVWNSAWGVHLNGCTNCKVQDNVLRHSIRKNGGDSANILLVNGSHYNVIQHNQCQYGGDGFFIGNEHGCPSNFNTIEGNDCSYALDNAFETTFSNGNVYKNNRADYSSYGFWLGYSYNSTVGDNSMIGNGHGIQIDHGQHNKITNNVIENNNGPGIYLDTDGKIHFPASMYKCLHLPNQRQSSHNVIAGNRFSNNNNFGVWLINTTFSAVYNNYFSDGKTISADGLTSQSSVYNFAPKPKLLPQGEYNIVGGRWLAGNWFWNYVGKGNASSGIGTTDIPYTDGNTIQPGSTKTVGDFFPLFIPNSKAP